MSRTTSGYLLSKSTAPLAREWLAQTVYKVPALGYLRDMFRSNVITAQELQSYHADLGYSDKDSERFVGIDQKLKARQNARMGSGWSPAAMRKAVAVGQLSRDDVLPIMLSQGFDEHTTDQLVLRAKSDLQYRVLSRSISQQLTQTVTQIRQAQTVGVMDESSAAAAMTALGYPADKAAGIATLTTAQARTARIKGAIQRIRHAYEQGEIDAEYARTSLNTLKVVPAAVDDYIAIWKIEMTPQRRRLTAKEVITEVAEGTVTLTDAHVRLHNLGYNDSDIAIEIAKAGRLVVDTPEALQFLDGMDGDKSGPHLARLADTAQGLSKRIVALLKLQEPPAKLSKWLLLGIVNCGYVRHRLRLYGWDEPAIGKWIQGTGSKKEGYPFINYDITDPNADSKCRGDDDEKEKDETNPDATTDGGGGTPANAGQSLPTPG